MNRMEIIYESRGCGKTTRLIEEAKKLPGYNLIVCIHRQEALRVWGCIKKLGYKLPMPITYDEFIGRKYYGKNINAFLMDNADMFLQQLARNVKIHAITFNKKGE